MKTPLPASINTVEEAKAFLKSLFENDEAFHPYDDPREVVYFNSNFQHVFTETEAEELIPLMAQVRSFETFDPYSYYLDLLANVEKPLLREWKELHRLN